MSAAPTNFCALRAKDYNGNHPPHPVRRRSMRFVLSLICCVLTLGAALAHASDHPSLAPTTPVHDETPTYVFSMGVGGGRHADDGVVQLRPGLHIRLKNTHLGKDGRLFGMDSSAPLSIDIVAPMHLTVKDHGLADGLWRTTEYDEASEFFSLLRRMEYGRLDGPWYMRLGALSDVRLGHGTILNHYQSNYRFDERRWGLHLKLQSPVRAANFCSTTSWSQDSLPRASSPRRGRIPKAPHATSALVSQWPAISLHPPHSTSIAQVKCALIANAIQKSPSAVMSPC